MFAFFRSTLDLGQKPPNGNKRPAFALDPQETFSDSFTSTGQWRDIIRVPVFVLHLPHNLNVVKTWVHCTNMSGGHFGVTISFHGNRLSFVPLRHKNLIAQTHDQGYDATF